VDLQRDVQDLQNNVREMDNKSQRVHTRRFRITIALSVGLGFGLRFIPLNQLFLALFDWLR